MRAALIYNTYRKNRGGTLLKKKYLGNTGLLVSEAGFGVLPMGPSQLALPIEEGAAVLRYALEQGFNFIDTAQYYQTYPYISKALETREFENVILKLNQTLESIRVLTDYLSTDPASLLRGKQQKPVLK